jgi:hypothetical protein
MGKRSNFERRDSDFYPTPRAAVLPLLPYLRGIRSFAEPCCGDGALIRHLESFGLACVYSGDIQSGQDALELISYGTCDSIITNPPWSRDVLHRLIAHFQNIAPTWLLLDADWKQTRQAAPYLPHCSDIVAIGRVKWIEGSKHTGKDNACWYRFDARHKAGPVFHWRDQGEEKACITTFNQRAGICELCGKRYELQRASARFCSPACRQHAYRKRLSVTPSVTRLSVTPIPSTPIEPSDSAYEYRYVKHPDVRRFMADGWERLAALDGTHHGEYSVLMRRRVEQDDGSKLSLI